MLNMQYRKQISLILLPALLAIVSYFISFQFDRLRDNGITVSIITFLVFSISIHMHYLGEILKDIEFLKNLLKEGSLLDKFYSLQLRRKEFIKYVGEAFLKTVINDLNLNNKDEDIIKFRGEDRGIYGYLCFFRALRDVYNDFTGVTAFAIHGAPIAIWQKQSWAMNMLDCHDHIIKKNAEIIRVFIGEKDIPKDDYIGVMRAHLKVEVEVRYLCKKYAIGKLYDFIYFEGKNLQYCFTWTTEKLGEENIDVGTCYESMSEELFNDLSTFKNRILKDEHLVSITEEKLEQFKKDAESPQ